MSTQRKSYRKYFFIIILTGLEDMIHINSCKTALNIEFFRADVTLQLTINIKENSDEKKVKDYKDTGHSRSTFNNSL